MKNKVIPKNEELTLSEDKLLVSKTDTKGVITYANPAFSEYSGYKEAELLGMQHNIVRHPDMPCLIFELMWQALQSKREFNGYLKNLSKTGQFYWVFANITPSFDENNEVIGYYSVRRKPDNEKLKFIKNLYLELRDIEESDSSNDAIDKSRFKLNSILNAREKGYDEFILSI